MTSVANTVAMTTLAVHILQPLIFYNIGLHRSVNRHPMYRLKLESGGYITRVG